MLSTHGRTVANALLQPVALTFLRLKIGPDAVSIAGTAGVVVAALTLIPQGHLAWAAVSIAGLALFDTVDGLLARELQARGVRRSKDFGAFLDSTLDRVADGAIFAGLTLWFSMAGQSRLDLLLALACLLFGSIVPYARARAEGLGMTASGGIAERADRLVAVLIAMFVVGVGAPAWVMTVVLALLAVASAITVVQRMVTVRRQAMQRLNDELAESAQVAAPATLEAPFAVDLRPRPRTSGLLVRRWVRAPAPRPVRDVEPWLVRRRRRRASARPRRGR